MQIDNDVPFVPNEPDDLHCYSASLLMILGHFVPNLPLHMDFANRMSGKHPDRAAWPLSAPLWMQRHGLDVSIVFDFDYHAVADNGIDYIRERYGDEVAEWQEANTDFPTRILVKEFLEEVEFERRIPQVQDIKNALNNGRLIGASVNSNLLNGEHDYANHYVVIKGMNDTEFIVHNPGLPPIAEQHVDIERFTRAWSYPSDDTRYLMSVGKQTTHEIEIEAILAFANT